MTNCTLCESREDLVFENDHARVLLHPDWSPRGHAMVVATRHVENASDLTEDQWLGLSRVWQRTERAILEATGAERAVIMKLGIQTPHLHIHIYPVRATDSREDVFAAIDGKRGEARDPSFLEKIRRHLTPDRH